MDSTVCNLKHEQVDKEIADVKEVQKDHTIRIGNLEQHDARLDEQIATLCKSLGSLTKTLQAAITMLVASFIGFFFYILQNHLTK